MDYYQHNKTEKKSYKQKKTEQRSFRATRILSADFVSPYKPSKFFFWYISLQDVYFYSNLYYKHK